MTPYEIKRLKLANYVRVATPQTDYWVGFTRSKLAEYLNGYGMNFNLIIGSDSKLEGGAYIIPFKKVRRLFKDEFISHDKDDRNRWIAHIKNHRFKITHCPEIIDVEEFYLDNVLFFYNLNYEGEEGSQITKNPRWHRDEIILTLDLYFDPNRGPIDDKNPRIQELSKILNQLPIQPIRPDAEKFRNANDVTLKLSNFLALDPDYSGKGMQSYSKLDEEVFLEFQNDKEKLHQIAANIRTIVQDENLVYELDSIGPIQESEQGEAVEGEVLFRLHKLRERSADLVKKKKQIVFSATEKLECEICQFDFSRIYGKIGKGYIECHHRVPLHQLTAARKTTIADLALVCANCHRMLHRSINTLTVEQLRKIVKPF